MCFSAEVSFGASAIISSVGVAALRNSDNKEQRLFAMVPFLFGIQQFFEGCLWLALGGLGTEQWTSFFTYGFLVFAQLIWPIWIPISVLAMENSKKRKQLITFFLACGVFLIGILAYRMMVYPVTAIIEQSHIYYAVGQFKSTNWWSGILYLLPAVFPFVFSSNKHVNYLGIAMLLLFVVSKVFYMKYMISTWCLFAAILSLYIYFILKRKAVVVI